MSLAFSQGGNDDQSGGMMMMMVTNFWCLLFGNFPIYGNFPTSGIMMMIMNSVSDTDPI